MEQSFSMHLFAFLSVTHMVFILDGCSEHVAHAWCKKGIFREKKIGFDHSFDVTKCLQQIEMPDLLQMCAHSEMSNHLL